MQLEVDTGRRQRGSSSDVRATGGQGAVALNQVSADFCGRH